MEIQTENGPIFTLQQTVQPFTKDLRLFNLKEANSTENCTGSMCAKSYLTQNYISDVETSLSRFLKEVKSQQKPQDNRSGLLNIEGFENDNAAANVGSMLNDRESPFISNDDRFMDPSNADVVNNANPHDYTYNSYADFYAPTFNQWTRIYDDNCNEENRLRIGSKPMKYYVNQVNSPQVDSFQEYSIIGNQKQYDVRNEFERPLPTRLNPIYPTVIEPYPTSPFLGQNYPDRVYTETSDALRWSKEIGLRAKKTETENSEKNFNRWDYVDPKTVQNAGQFNLKMQSNIDPRDMGASVPVSALRALNDGPRAGINNSEIDSNGYYDYEAENHVIMGNGAVNYWGISTRDLLHNLTELANL